MFRTGSDRQRIITAPDSPRERRWTTKEKIPSDWIKAESSVSLVQWLSLFMVVAIIRNVKQICPHRLSLK